MAKIGSFPKILLFYLPKILFPKKKLGFSHDFFRILEKKKLKVGLFRLSMVGLPLTKNFFYGETGRVPLSIHNTMFSLNTCLN